MVGGTTINWHGASDALAAAGYRVLCDHLELTERVSEYNPARLSALAAVRAAPGAVVAA